MGASSYALEADAVEPRHRLDDGHAQAAQWGSPVTAILLSLATFASTLIGGLLAFRLHRQLRHVLAFTSGVLLGVVFFEVVPEIFRLSAARALDPTGAMVLLVAGVVVFRAIERFLAGPGAPALESGEHGRPRFGLASALALIGHSALDGVAIGLAFQASNAVGIAVAVAVIAHDFCDGLNTVGLMLGHGNARPLSAVMLALDAIAPVAGAASTLLLRVPVGVLLAYLGLFAGFLLAVTLSQTLAAPAANWRTSAALVALTVLGCSLPFVVARFAP
jgi:zinc transporter ZupT